MHHPVCRIDCLHIFCVQVIDSHHIDTALLRRAALCSTDSLCAHAYLESVVKPKTCFLPSDTRYKDCSWKFLVIRQPGKEGLFWRDALFLLFLMANTDVLANPTHADCTVCHAQVFQVHKLIAIVVIEQQLLLDPNCKHGSLRVPSKALGIARSVGLTLYTECRKMIQAHSIIIQAQQQILFWPGLKANEDFSWKDRP